jgi:hypothetical protein
MISFPLFNVNMSLAQMVTKTPELFQFVFLGIKERLKEAPFMP